MELYQILLYTIFIVSPVIFLTLLFVTAPYGRHVKRGWGIRLNNKLAWVLMELPAVLTIAIVYFKYMKEIHPINGIFLGLWLFHYLYRTFWFPFQIKSSKKSFPILIILSAVIFNIINGYINGYYLFRLDPLSGTQGLQSVHFFVGIILFLVGFALHFVSDKTILNLRKDSSEEYSIPFGGLFKYVSNPNYFGEFIQWMGWAILCWSPAGLAFAIFTLANLLPRAISNHKWYLAKFKTYPKERRVFFPFIY